MGFLARLLGRTPEQVAEREAAAAARPAEDARRRQLTEEVSPISGISPELIIESPQV